MYLAFDPHQVETLQGSGKVYGLPPNTCAAPHQLLHLLTLADHPIHCTLSQLCWSTRACKAEQVEARAKKYSQYEATHVYDITGTTPMQ